MSETDKKLWDMLMDAASQGARDLEGDIWYVTESIVQNLYYLSTNLENAGKVLADARNQEGFLIQERNADLDDVFRGEHQFGRILLEHLPAEHFRPSTRAKTPPLAGGIATIASSDILGKDFPLPSKADPSILGSKPDLFRLALELMTRSDRHLAANQRDIAAAEITRAEHRIEAYLFLYTVRDRLIRATKHLGSEATANVLEDYGFGLATDTEPGR